MEDFVVTCPLVPDVPHLISGSCSPDQVRGRLCPALLGWTSSRPHLTMTPLPFFLRLGSGQALTFGSDNTWYEDFHLASPGRSRNRSCPRPPPRIPACGT